MRETGSSISEQLVKKVADIIATDDLEGQIQAVPFQCAEYPSPDFSELLNDELWTGDDFPHWLQKMMSLLI